MFKESLREPAILPDLVSSLKWAKGGAGDEQALTEAGNRRGY